MDAAIAAAVAHATREQAADDARADAKTLRAQAVEAGRERSRSIIKTSRIDPRTGEIRYNPAGRLLRDWYLHVYLNQLRTRLGEPAIAIDAQQVEDAVSLLRRLRPAVDGRSTLHAVAATRNMAADDAARAAAATLDRMHEIGVHRALQHAPDDRFDGDELRVEVTRHWYLRCYNDQVEQATETRQPLTAVTNAETDLVARVLHTAEPVRVVGDDGVPLINAHGTAMTDTDRRAAAGETGLASALTDPVQHPDPFETLESRLTRAWNKMGGAAREYWLHCAGADQTQSAHRWSRLPDAVQDQIVQLYLRAGGPRQNDPRPFTGIAVREQPAIAAQAMFNHPNALHSQAETRSSANRNQTTNYPDDRERLHAVEPVARGLTGP